MQIRNCHSPLYSKKVFLQHDHVHKIDAYLQSPKLQMQTYLTIVQDTGHPNSGRLPRVPQYLNLYEIVRPMNLTHGAGS